MVRDDYTVTGSAGKEGGTGEAGFLVGVAVFVGRVLSGSCGVDFFLAASIVRTTRHARQKEDVKGEKV